jgi:hypothetical protein
MSRLVSTNSDPLTSLSMTYGNAEASDAADADVRRRGAEVDSHAVDTNATTRAVTIDETRMVEAPR